MRILQVDSVGGASGDMILALLCDLGADPNALQEELESGLSMDGFRIEARTSESHGLHGTQVFVHTQEDPSDHHHRAFSDIRRLIENSTLDQLTRERSLHVFGRLAEVEAAIHRQSIDDVHFHEVGAVDSIVDIVGGCAAMRALDIDEVAVGPLPIGRGTVDCQHGTYPVPAPATAELLKGHPLIATDEPGEIVTPTGAALLMTWKARDLAPAGSRIVKVGQSFGHRKLSTRPSLLRGILMEWDEASSASSIST